MRELMIVAGLLFCNVAQAKVPSPKFKVGECLISKADSDKIDPWQLDNVAVYRIDKVGKVSYRTGNPSRGTLNPTSIIEFSSQDAYAKVSCKKYIDDRENK
jgi:hypothetical protein